ncbi:sulfonate ABC transporter substrate-binding protein [Xylophilus sp.]|uniref:sulfonate ABC transporter substrate-binding protein n=1 Tax=Xylophilus sp. TaxID=2653893 RepID=UPI0013B6B4D0|nr:sulfonate ABC transporter substrate-binding protein [Xylophilus sp.]KAF1048710.1 MAG: putative aliphatic sulfonates-binding protein [Xylophilus sp.]
MPNDHRFPSLDLTRRRLVAGAGALAFGAPALAQQPPGRTLRIGYQKYGSLVLLKGDGGLEKQLAAQGTSVTWTEFPGGPQLLEALNVGAIDFGSTGEAPPVFAQAAGADLVYVGVEPPSPAGEAILVKADSPIRTVADLKGRRIAFNKGSNVHYLLVKALEAAGVQYGEVQATFLAPADGRAAFASGSVDAWAIWDPFLAAAEKQLPTRTLRDGQGLVSNYQFYLASRRYAQAHPQVVSLALRELDRTGRWAKAHLPEAAKQIAPLIGLTPEITQLALGRQGYGAAPLGAEVTAQQQAVADAFFQLRLIPKPVKVADAVWQARG